MNIDFDHRERYRRPPSELYGADAYVERPQLPEALRPILRGFGLPIGAGIAEGRARPDLGEGVHVRRAPPAAPRPAEVPVPSPLPPAPSVIESPPAPPAPSAIESPPAPPAPSAIESPPAPPAPSAIESPPDRVQGDPLGAEIARRRGPCRRRRRGSGRRDGRGSRALLSADRCGCAGVEGLRR
jgi:hypothetical protein